MLAFSFENLRKDVAEFLEVERWSVYYKQFEFVFLPLEISMTC